MNNSFRQSNYNSSPTGDGLSWAVIIVCLVVFWPLGLFLLIRKFNFSTKLQKLNNCTGGRGQQAAPPRQEAEQTQDNNAGNRVRSDRAAKGPVTGASYHNISSPQRPYTVRRNQEESNTAPDASSHPQGFTGASDSKHGSNLRNHNKSNKTDKMLVILLTLLIIFLCLAAVSLLSVGFSSIFITGLTAVNLFLSVLGSFCLLGALISFILRSMVVKRTRRYYRYQAILGSRTVISVADLAKATGEKSPKTRRYLQSIIELGYFGSTAYFDSTHDSLALSYEAAEKVLAERQQETSTGTAAAGKENRYVIIINELHLISSQTADLSICSKIQTLQELTAKIFKIADDKPDKLPQLRRFMNYYLPTTLKLLHSYGTLEKQGINGENIFSAKQDIVRVLDTLVVGYEQQLDSLFKSDKLHISADIEVLETLMTQDGLSGCNSFRNQPEHIDP